MPWERLFPIVPEATFFAGIGKAVAAVLHTADHGGPGRVAGFHVCPSSAITPGNTSACKRRSWDDVVAGLPNLARELLWEVEGSRVAENVLLQARRQCGRGQQVLRSCAAPQNASSCWRSVKLHALEYMVWKRHGLWRHCALNVAVPPASGLAPSCYDERSCEVLWQWLQGCFGHTNADAHGAYLPLMMPSGLRANDVAGLDQTSRWLDGLGPAHSVAPSSPFAPTEAPARRSPDQVARGRGHARFG